MENLFGSDSRDGWRSGLKRNEIRLRRESRSVELETSARFK